MPMLKTLRSVLSAAATAVLLAAAPLHAGEPGRAAPVATAAAGEADPLAFAKGLYLKLEGRQPDIPALAAALDTGLLLDRVTAGLTASPPEAWLAAARARLGGEMMGAAGHFFPRGSMVIAPQVIGPAREEGAGAVAVTVRFYQPGTGGAVWHRLHLQRTAAGWRIADIEDLENCGTLSSVALSRLNDPEDEPLPAEDPGGMAGLLLGRLLPGLGAALVLGLACYLLLAKPKRFPGAGLLTLAAAVLPLLVGGGLFMTGLSGHLDHSSAVTELAQRARSRAIYVQAENTLEEARRQGGQGDSAQAEGMMSAAAGACDQALKLWNGNRQAMLLKARILGFSSSRSEADQYIQILAGDAMKPPMPAARLELARQHQRARQYRKAAEAYAAFNEAVGPDAYAMWSAAQCLAMAGDFRGAEDALKAAKAAQDFDTVGSEGFDEIMVLGRAAVRAAQKRVPEVVADCDLFLKPYEARPEEWLVRCNQLFLNVQSGQFGAVIEDAAFREYLQKLGKRMRDVARAQGYEIREMPEPGGE